MFEVRLQIGCLIIVLYIVVAYIKESFRNEITCNPIFDALLITVPGAVIFDGVTAWSVNHLDVVPHWMNILLHGAFFICMDGTMLLIFIYMLDQTVGVKYNKYFWFYLIPGILSFVVILFHLEQLHFIKGKTTNYSLGISVYACFVSVIIHFLMICALLCIKRRFLERHKINSLIVSMVIILCLLAIQVIFPEMLISSILPTIALLSFYITFENPALRRLQRYHEDMVTGFATLVENRDDSTGGHIRRTKEYVHIILNAAKENPKYNKLYTRDYFSHIINAAPMHDIGKIATPDQILQKPGKLTDEEYDIMKEHAATGGDIIKETFSSLNDPEYQQVAYEVARFHHEKWNGRGYPDGLSGEDIPFHARVMAIADVFDAVSAKRCYRDAMPIDKCFKIIEEGIGKDFDPELATIFLESKDKVLAYYNRDQKQSGN